jgi:hypothetical protein
MRRFRERFLAAPQTRDFFAFLKGTDGLLHIRGPKRLEVALETLDQILKEIQAACGEETEMVLFSDHGMSLREHKRINLQTHLRKCGYQLAGSLRDMTERKRVALPAFGLIGFAALYTVDEEAASMLAQDVASLEGVDFAIHRDGQAVIVKGERGAARIEQYENGRGLLYRYQPLTGDPLYLSSVLKELQQSGQLDQKGFAPDTTWYERTAEHLYPDALANLYTAMHAPRVGHTADVLISTRDGYYYGNTAFSRFVRLAATHGNAARDSSSAFLMSTHRSFTPAVRATEAQPLLKG